MRVNFDNFDFEENEITGEPEDEVGNTVENFEVSLRQGYDICIQGSVSHVTFEMFEQEVA